VEGKAVRAQQNARPNSDTLILVVYALVNKSDAHAPGGGTAPIAVQHGDRLRHQILATSSIMTKRLALLKRWIRIGYRRSTHSLAKVLKFECSLCGLLRRPEG